MGASSVSADTVSQCVAGGEGIGESSGPVSSMIGCGGSNREGDAPGFTVRSEANSGWTRWFVNKDWQGPGGQVVSGYQAAVLEL